MGLWEGNPFPSQLCVEEDGKEKEWRVRGWTWKQPVHSGTVKFNMQERKQRNKRDTSPLKGNIIYSVQPGGP